ncbi:hypothetical protein [Roseateles sp.]|uniref:hypothetical protein n=1 Tax=Roseateles sp. TaxID=1971397 RepID=UPI002E073A4F|nr:hypothetical protein [Roseateles sp.]
MTYQAKVYGRNDEVAALYKMFEAGRDVSMPGPRRLGKTFLLDRLVDAAPRYNWTAVKVELAGCADTRAVFRELCARIGTKRSGGARAKDWFLQRFSQFLGHRTELGGAWYQGLLTVDYESHFERLITAMNEDPQRRWLLLIDELPIFLKALHDKGSAGVAAARDFMNLTARLRQQNPKVRWMITGSIGIEPLAQAGAYVGVLAKFQAFELQPLSVTQAKAFVQDQAAAGHLPGRSSISNAEAEALVAAVGWRAAFYLDALAQKLGGAPSDDPLQARSAVEEAVNRLLLPAERATFGPWEEHLRKHYQEAERALAFGVLGSLAERDQGTDMDGLLAALGRPGLTRDDLQSLLVRLHAEGFVTIDGWDDDSPQCAFRNPLLRRWWSRYRPQAIA